MEENVMENVSNTVPAVVSKTGIKFGKREAIGFVSLVACAGYLLYNKLKKRKGRVVEAESVETDMIEESEEVE